MIRSCQARHDTFDLSLEALKKCLLEFVFMVGSLPSSQLWYIGMPAVLICMQRVGCKSWVVGAVSVVLLNALNCPVNSYWEETRSKDLVVETQMSKMWRFALFFPLIHLPPDLSFLSLPGWASLQTSQLGWCGSQTSRPSFQTCSCQSLKMLSLFTTVSCLSVCLQSGDDDTSQFDIKFTRQPAVDSPDDSLVSESADLHFKGFTYVAPCVLESLSRPGLPRFGYSNLHSDSLLTHSLFLLQITSEENFKSTSPCQVWWKPQDVITRHCCQLIRLFKEIGHMSSFHPNSRMSENMTNKEKNSTTHSNLQPAVGAFVAKQTILGTSSDKVLFSRFLVRFCWDQFLVGGGQMVQSPTRLGLCSPVGLLCLISFPDSANNCGWVARMATV